MTNKFNINEKVFFSDPEKRSDSEKHTNISMGTITGINYFSKDGHSNIIYTLKIDCAVNHKPKRWEVRTHEMSEGCLHRTFTEADLLWKKAKRLIR